MKTIVSLIFTSFHRLIRGMLIRFLSEVAPGNEQDVTTKSATLVGGGQIIAKKFGKTSKACSVLPS
jgi:hypothetical protein